MATKSDLEELEAYGPGPETEPAEPTTLDNPHHILGEVEARRVKSLQVRRPTGPD